MRLPQSPQLVQMQLPAILLLLQLHLDTALCAGHDSHWRSDNSIQGFTDSQGRHYPRNPSLLTQLYHYKDNPEFSKQISKSPAALHERLPGASRRHEGRGRRLQKTAFHRTSQWGNVEIPHNGATVRVYPSRGNRKALRGSVTTTVLSPEQTALRRRQAILRSGPGSYIHDAPWSKKHCIQCPSDRAVVASRGHDRVIMEQPELINCNSDNSLDQMTDIRLDWIRGPRPGDLMEEGKHVVEVRIMYRNKVLQKCRYLYAVIVRQCPQLKLPNHLVADCTMGNIWGSRCEFKCQHGLRIIGHSSTVCEEDLNWSHHIPQCKAEEFGCPIPMGPENGHLGCKTPDGGLLGPLPENSTCRFECENGYVIPDEQLHLSIITCKGGQWNSTTDPTCLPLETKKVASTETIKESKRHSKHRRHRAHKRRTKAFPTGDDPCESNPCEEGGTCLQGPSSAPVLCICPDHRQGDFCEREKCPDVTYCLNGGQCAMVNAEFVCYCPKGYSGARCESKGSS